VSRVFLHGCGERRPRPWRMELEVLPRLAAKQIPARVHQARGVGREARRPGGGWSLEAGRRLAGGVARPGTPGRAKGAEGAWGHRGDQGWRDATRAVAVAAPHRGIARVREGRR